MLTEKQIRDEAFSIYPNSNIRSGGFIDGATWANEQNAAEIAQKDREIAELVGILRDVSEALTNGFPKFANSKIKRTLEKYEK